jgi:hypothetical protein
MRHLKKESNHTFFLFDNRAGTISSRSLTKNLLGIQASLLLVEKAMMLTCWTATCKLTASEEGCGISARRNPHACLLLLKLLCTTMLHCLNNYSMRKRIGCYVIIE